MGPRNTMLSVALVALAAFVPGAFSARQLLQQSQTVRWYEPSNGALNDVSTPVGSSLVFEWTGTHDLWEVPSRACPATFTNGTGITQLAPESRGGSARVQFSSAGIRYFACSVGDHCEDGQLIAVNVGGAPAPAPGNRYRGGSSSNYGANGEPISNYGGSNYGEEDEDEEDGYGGGNAPAASRGGSGYGSGYGSNYGSGR